VSRDFALFAACWRETPLLTGLDCDACGVPLPGEDSGTAEHCDDCLAIARPWDRGRAVFAYRVAARRMVLALKHGDRLDLVRPAARWLAQAAAPLLRPDTLIVPVPIHWRRLLARRFNQSAELARALSRDTGHACVPDLLVRSRATPILDGLGREARFAALSGTIRPHPRRGAAARGRPVLIVDDVMTSGATLAATAEAARAAGAGQVDMVTLARVAKDA
jgi:predicted amidophosphoribosyltransferase